MPEQIIRMAKRINMDSHRTTLVGSVDALSGLAPLLRVRPELRQVCRFGAQWALEPTREPGLWAPFHLITQGACVLELNDGGRSVPLSAGDIAVLPHGSRHAVRSLSTPTGARGSFGISSQPHGDVELLSNTDEEAETQFICGRLHFDLAHNNLVLMALPDVIVASSAAGGPIATRLNMLICAIQEELEDAQAGAAAVATNLASALFVMVVRIHLECEDCNEGLLGLLAHQQTGRAVVAMLGDPVKSWTLDELAASANSSRANLVRIFRRVAQLSPLALLTEIRLELARSKLSTTALPIAAIAEEVGYKSESAFSRAFYRRFGMRPGEARTAAARSTQASA